MDMRESFRFAAVGLLNSMRWVSRDDTCGFKQKTTELGATADYRNPKQLGDLVDSELTRGDAVTKAAKVEAD